MKYKLFTSLFFSFSFLFSFHAQALELDRDWIERRCEDLLESPQVSFSEFALSSGCAENTNSDSSLDDLAQDFPKDIYELNLFIDKIEPILENIHQHIEDWGDFKRWMSGMTLKKPEEYDSHERVFEDLVFGAKYLIEAYEEREKVNRRLQVCRSSHCGISRTLEFEDARDELDQWILSLATQNHWWISEEFNQWASERAEIAVDSGDEHRELSDQEKEELKKILNENFGKFFRNAAKLKSDLNSMRALGGHYEDENGPQEISSRLFFDYLNRYGESFDFALMYLLKNEVTQWPYWQKESLCSLALRASKIRDRVDGSKKGAEWGLIGASIATGPDAFTPVWLSRLSRFLPWVGRSRAAYILPEAGLTLHFGNEWKSLRQQCDRNLENWRLQGTDEKEDVIQWEECQRLRHGAMVSTLLSGAATGVVSLPMARKAYLKYSEAKNTADKTSVVKSGQFEGIDDYLGSLSPRELREALNEGQVLINQVKGRGHFAILNLSKRERFQGHQLERLPNDYWEHVGETYRQRLNLSDSEIKSFIDSSRQLEDRTKLIVHTSRGPPSKPAHQIEGGVAYVETSRSEDLLPLEKATDFRVPRNEGKAIEVVRLSSSSESGAQGMSDLLRQTARVVQSDSEVKYVYVFTSKVHHRLYKRLNIKSEIVDRPNERDIIYKIEATDFITALQKYFFRQPL